MIKQDKRALDAIADVFGIGNATRTPSTILANVVNAKRRADCLSAIEREFFTKLVEDEDEGGMVEECQLNWGASPDEYVEQFRRIRQEYKGEPVKNTNWQIRKIGTGQYYDLWSVKCDGYKEIFADSEDTARRIAETCQLQKEDAPPVATPYIATASPQPSADDVAWKGEERRSQYNYHDKYLPPHRTAQRSTDESIRAMKGKQNAGEKK